MQFSKVIVTISAAFAIAHAQNESNETSTDNGAVGFASSNAGMIGAAAAAVGAALLF